MEDPQIARIIEQLGTHAFQQAWTEFLEAYSPLILHTVKLFERDADPVADCFLFVCERLSEKNFRRLRSFKLDGAARFSTWLRVVLRNLCLDWHRKEFGRHRIFQSIARLDALDQDIFRCIYEQGLAKEKSFVILRAKHPRLTMAHLEEGLARVKGVLTDRQIWLAAERPPVVQSLDSGPADDPQRVSNEFIDPSPNPESLFAMNEQREELERALRRLSKPERLLIKLRFEQGLTLQETAQLLDLKDAQTVDRRQRDIIDQLRKDLKKFPASGGKTGAASV
ncbi:MAG: RNA polymerase sigma factor [Terriglobia bacterium]